MSKDFCSLILKKNKNVQRPVTVAFQRPVTVALKYSDGFPPSTEKHKHTEHSPPIESEIFHHYM